MNALYARLVDRIASPGLEKMLRLGRRRGGERRLTNMDRRYNTDDIFLYSQSERRNAETIRRNPDQDERRRQWYRINSFQSRHLI